MTKERYAELVAMETVGMGVAEVMALLMILWPLIQKLPCFERKKAKLMAAMVNEHRECCRNKSRCPPRLRRVIEANGASPSEFWRAMNVVAFSHDEEVATMMMSL
jgi:hypothetical protein